LKTKILGDFQTPVKLASQIVNVLMNGGNSWGRVLEPTCGEGNFIQALIAAGDLESAIVGIELQDEYTKKATSKFKNFANVTILKRSVFDINLEKDIECK
jgi:hypothetical protein